MDFQPFYMDNRPIRRYFLAPLVTQNEPHGMNPMTKSEGFPGQRIAILPRPVVALAQTQPLTRGLLPTDVGWFPRAEGHRRERPLGASQTIFIYCANGAGWCELAGENHAVRPGDLLVIPKATPHRYGADPRQPWSILWFHATGGLVEPFLVELGVKPHQPVVRLGNDSRWQALFEEVLDAVEHGYTTPQLLYASQTLGHLLAAMVRSQHTGQTKEPTPQQRVARTIEYMKLNRNRSVALGTLAGMAHLSRSQYAALFKQQTGYSPIDYGIRLRMHYACQLLDTTELSVKAVATQLGFEDPLYFSRAFRRVNEQSPTAYRKLRKG